MDSSTLIQKAEEAVITVLHSLEVSRAINGLPSSELSKVPSQRRVGTSLMAEVDKANYDDPTFVAQAFVAWCAGYDVDQAAKLIGARDYQVGDVWRSAGLRKVNPMDLNEQRKTQLEGAIDVAGDTVHTTLGTTPSGMPSLANMYTFAKGTFAVTEAVGNKGKGYDILFGVNDHLVDADETELARRSQALDGVIASLERELGVSITRSDFSNMQKSQEFRALLQRAADRKMFACDKAYGLTLAEKKFLRGNYEHVCGDEANKRIDYEKSMSDFYTELATTVLLRNGLANSDVHILGGDINHALKLRSKARQLGVASPHVHTTGVMYGPDGDEMHASYGNTILQEDLKSPDTWVEDVAALNPRPTGEIGILEYQHLLTDQARERMYRPGPVRQDPTMAFLNQLLDGGTPVIIEYIDL